MIITIQKSKKDKQPYEITIGSKAISYNKKLLPKNLADFTVIDTDKQIAIGKSTSYTLTKKAVTKKVKIHDGKHPVVVEPAITETRTVNGKDTQVITKPAVMGITQTKPEYAEEVITPAQYKRNITKVDYKYSDFNKLISNLQTKVKQQ